MFENSQIVICKDIEIYLDEVLPTFNVHQTRVFKSQKESFSIAESKMVIKESYTASENDKYIFICAKRFGIEAQNSLLKVLEEPPRNVIFIIVTNSKSVLLPTIRSRLPLFEHDKQEPIVAIDFDYNRFDLAFFQNFVKENKYISKEEAKVYLQALFLSIASTGIKLDEYHLEKFSNSLKMLELNIRPINILTRIFLMLLNSKNKARV
jgi:DNA polymerase-3 subunit delta'